MSLGSNHIDDQKDLSRLMMEKVISDEPICQISIRCDKVMNIDPISHINGDIGVGSNHPITANAIGSDGSSNERKISNNTIEGMASGSIRNHGIDGMMI